MADESLIYPPALFLYQVTPTAVPYSEPSSLSTVSLMFIVSNTSGHDVEVDNILFDLRHGSGTHDLTTSGQLYPRPVVGPDWSAGGDGDGRVRATPNGPPAFRGLRAGESLGVVVPGVVVNSEPGIANLVVRESSDELRLSYVSVVKNQPGLAISSFQASPVQLDRQHPSSILTWKASGASLVTLSHDGATEQVTANGFKEVTPRVTTLYTLTATGAGGPIHEQLTVYVPQVALVSFGADPPLIASGQQSTLRWALVNATEAMILASGDEPDPGRASLPAGEHTVSPHQPTTTYTLAASGFGNVVAGIAQVDHVPTVELFSVTPEQAPRYAGLPLVVAWKVSGTASVSVSGLPSPQPSESSAVVYPRRTTLYTLSAKRLTPARTVRATLAGQITAVDVSALGKKIGWNGSGADAARLTTNGKQTDVSFTSGEEDIGAGQSRLEMISTAADWSNYIDVVLSAKPVSPAISVSAASAYGISAVGAVITLDWSAEGEPGHRILVRNGKFEHSWTTAQGPATFVVQPTSDRILWQLSVPTVMTWTVYAGEPWISAAADDTGGGVP